MATTLEFKSTNLKAATWEAGNTLEVTFVNGSKVKFGNVTADQFEALGKSDSAGRWFHQNVKSKPKDHPILSKTPAPIVMPVADATKKPADVAAAASSPPGETADDVVEETEVVDQKVDENKCTASVREHARATYEAYIKNSDGKNFRGEPCPTWPELTTEVRSHWCAAVIAVDKLVHAEVMESVEQLRAEHTALRDENAALVETAKKLTVQISTAQAQPARPDRPLRPWHLRRQPIPTEPTEPK